MQNSLCLSRESMASGFEIMADSNVTKRMDTVISGSSSKKAAKILFRENNGQLNTRVPEVWKADCGFDHEGELILYPRIHCSCMYRLQDLGEGLARMKQQYRT